MEINREKFRVAALLIALANTGCGPAHRQINYQEEETGWTGSAPPPSHLSPGPTAEYYPPPYEAGLYAPPPYEGGYYGPPAEEWYPPPAEYYPPSGTPVFE
ncbi:MAG: hypothetical protein GYA57_12870 [Myxococcales bacterium]|nr:hypothetical protein [Myxococcales bacterium]